MKYAIPKGGVVVHVGKKLVKLNAGEHETTDKDEMKALDGAKGVTKSAAKGKAES